MRVVLAVCALAGCADLFNLEQVKPVDAPPPPPPCEDPSPFGTECRELDLVLTGDTYISASSPDTPLGSRDGIHISASDVALLRFDTSTIAPDERIASMQVTLVPYYSNQAKVCSPDPMMCFMCPPPDIEGWNLQWVITTWNQATATWNAADEPWALPGAAAIPADRSELVASGPRPAPPNDLVIDVPADALLRHSPTAIATWIVSPWR